MSAIKHHYELDVYKEAFDLAMRVFERTKDWPAEERFSLTDQIRRSSRAVCANLAEAWRKRLYPKHFVTKVNDAEAEAAETQTWIQFAVKCGYLNKEDAQSFFSTYHEVLSKLVNFRLNADRWALKN